MRIRNRRKQSDPRRKYSKFNFKCSSRSWFLISLLVFLYTYKTIQKLTTSIRSSSPSLPSFNFEHTTIAQLCDQNQFNDSLQILLSQFHKLVITDYLEYHRSHTNDIRYNRLRRTNTRFLIFRGREARKGLGDRFRGILNAYLCALVTDRVLLIQWENPFLLSSIFSMDNFANFTYDKTIFGERLIRNHSTNIQFYYGEGLQDLGILATHVQMVIMRSERAVDWNGLFKVKDRYPMLKISKQLHRFSALEKVLEGDHFYPLLLKAIFRPTLKLRRGIKARVKQTVHNSQFGTIFPSWIGIHVRLGYALREYIPRFDLNAHGLTNESVAQCIARYAIKLQLLSQHSPTFFIATDTPEIRPMVENSIKVLNPAAKVIYATWDVVHVRDMKPNDDSYFEQVLDTFAELYLMSQSKSLVHLHSGFVNLAKWMGCVKRAKIIMLQDCG